MRGHSDYTRIQNRFHGYTTEDCACGFCLYYTGDKNDPCYLQKCCCEEERMQAAETERRQAAIRNNIMRNGQ